MSTPSSPHLDTRPPRDAIAGSEWAIHAVLMRDGQVIEEADHRLRISDTRLVKEFADTTRAVGLWLDDLAQARARREKAAKKVKRR